MPLFKSARRVAGLSLLATLPFLALHSQPSQADDSLEAFASQEGRFAIRLPGKPKYEKVPIAEGKTTQHQFTVGGEQGAYVVSYQDNDNLAGGTVDDLKRALESGRDRLKQVFRGELLENKEIELDKKHPGLDFRLTIPQAKGEARCRMYMVDTRLYQVMVIGTPEFVADDEVTQVIESFELAE